MIVILMEMTRKYFLNMTKIMTIMKKLLIIMILMLSGCVDDVYDDDSYNDDTNK